MKKFRNMKVYEQSGYQYKSTPAIMLKGQWLREAGFDCKTSINVTCEEGRLVIVPREMPCGHCRTAGFAPMCMMN
ncbi:MAG: SymE family type I addiction module toxin [Eubacteriales bacterium]|nr:SymE family type I addiction module toxin [Eubacteriales bacterium]